MFQVKINGQNEEMLRAAIEQFGDKTDDEIAFGNIFSVYFFLKSGRFFPQYICFLKFETIRLHLLIREFFAYTKLSVKR